MYYKLNDKIYGNKIEALVDAQEYTGDANNIEFIPHADWESFNWLDEPPEPWEEVLRQHALNLRIKYSYLRLWFSGGVDSQTILNTFIKNNIHLDEIVLVRDSPVDKFDTFENGEINWVAIPFIKAHKKSLAKTFINIINSGSKAYYNLWKNEKHFVENHTNSDFNVPHGMIAYNDIIPKAIQPQKNAANIFGLEKPLIGLDETGFYMYHVDTLSIWQSTDNPSNAKDTPEYFYLAPKVWSKQCHMVKNFCKEKRDDYLQILVDGKRLSLSTTDNICRDPLYIPFSTGKSVNIERLNKNSINSRCFKDVFRENLAVNYDPKLVDMNNYLWTNLEQTIRNNIGNQWFNNKKNIKDGIIGKLSKKYYLEHSHEFYNESISESNDELEFRNAISAFYNTGKDLKSSDTLILPSDSVEVNINRLKPLD